MRSTRPKNAKYRVAVIGCGSHGTRLARAFDLNPLTEVVAGVNRGQDGLDLFCKRFNARGYNDYREMLKKERFDIALLGLPVNVNAEVVVACAEYGVKGIFSEKPIALSLAEADAAVEACAKRGIPWGAGDMFRNDPEIWTAKRLVDSGDIGEIESINVYGAGGNQMSGQGCRQMSELLLFAGDGPVDWVLGETGGDPADRELGRVDEWSDNDQDIVWGIVRFKNGITAHVHKNVGSKSGTEVIGSKGVLYIGQGRVGNVWHVDGKDLKFTGSLFPYPDTADVALGTNYDSEGWEIQRTRLVNSVNALVDAVDTGAPVLCSGETLRQSLELVIAMRESHRRGIVKVNMPLEDRSLKVIPSARRHVGRRISESNEAFMKHIKPHKREVVGSK
ncbi:MAG: Gfo/Idh/MocA family oxidoreductase [SAR202 cluster bacterium]|nr:Gfo/Idh/MocA family oxidoreductase [SAR202 cluster bacterium]